MVDPILGDDLSKRLHRIEVYNEYQNRLDELDGKSAFMYPSGKMDGKTVYQLGNDPLMQNIFKNSVNH